MTRKKFIKELMGFGESRNQAVIYANEVNKRGIPYVRGMAIYVEASLIVLCEKLGIATIY